MLDAIFGSLLFNVLLFVSAIASIVSLLLGLRRYPRSAIIAHVLLVVALSAFSSYSFFAYKAGKDAEVALEKKKETARREAAFLLRGLPSNIDYWQAGQGRGIALAGLAFLEQYRELYPATFALAQVTVRVDIEAAQKVPDTSEERRRMETAGVSMLQILRGIAGRETPDN